MFPDKFEILLIKFADFVVYEIHCFRSLYPLARYSYGYFSTTNALDAAAVSRDRFLCPLRGGDTLCSSSIMIML